MLTTTHLDEKVEILSNVNLFNGLSDSAMDNLADMTQKITFSKGRKIYSIGDECDEVFIIIRGMIKICRYSDDGREVIKNILSPNSVFGESGIYDIRERVDNAISLDNNLELLVFNVQDLKDYMRSEWDLTSNIVKFLGKRKILAEKRFESVVLNDARTRIIDFLKDNANQLGQKIGYEMLIKHSLTQQDIANFTGTSRQTVTSVLNDLKKTNQIYFKRKSILIRDITTLS